MIETHHVRDILLVEDDALDVAVLRRVFQSIGVTDTLVPVTSGEQALTYLRAPCRQLPRVILLDLDLPSMAGLEFLEIVSVDKTLNSIPVVVVSASDSQEERARSLALGAVAWVAKCPDYREFRQKIKDLVPYFGPIGLSQGEATALSSHTQRALQER
jgi:CheY-like chemotaxis protein